MKQALCTIAGLACLLVVGPVKNAHALSCALSYRTEVITPNGAILPLQPTIHVRFNTDQGLRAFRKAKLVPTSGRSIPLKITRQRRGAWNWRFIELQPTRKLKAGTYRLEVPKKFKGARDRLDRTWHVKAKGGAPSKLSWVSAPKIESSYYRDIKMGDSGRIVLNVQASGGVRPYVAQVNLTYAKGRNRRPWYVGQIINGKLALNDGLCGGYVDLREGDLKIELSLRDAVGQELKTSTLQLKVAHQKQPPPGKGL